MSTIESSPAAIIFYLYSVIITVTQAVPVYQDYLRYYVKDYSDSRSIRPLTCKSLDGTVGVCMFSLACRHANGHPIGLCKDTIYSGSCCRLPVNNNNTHDGSHVDEVENFLEYPVGTNRTSPKVPIVNVSQSLSPSSTTSLPSSPSTSTTAFSPSISTTITTAASISTTTQADNTTPIASSYPATLLSSSSSTSQSTSSSTSSSTSPPTLPTSLPASSTSSSTSASSAASSTASSSTSSATSPATASSTSPSTSSPTSSILSTLSSEPSSLKTTQQSSSTVSNLVTTVTSLDTSEFPTTQGDGEEETKKESMYMIDDGKVRSSSTTAFLTSTSSTQVPIKLTESTISSQSMITSDAPSSQLTNKPDSLTNPSTASTSSESTSLHSTLTSSTATRTATVSTSPPTTPLKTAPPTPAIVSTLSTSTTTTTTTTKSPPPSSTTSTTTIKIPTLNRITSPSTVAPKNQTNHQGIKAICGRKMNGPGPTARIVGGSQSSFSEWPWMVSTRQWKKNAFLHKCGAALLNEYWAITAAHCVENVAPTDLLLRLGEYDISHEDEPFGHIERRVQIIAPHPKFDPRTFEYDLALLRFYEPITFRKNILPICIPEGNKSFVGRKATVTGWGRLYEEGPLPNTLQHVEVPVITNQECEMMYRRAGYLEEIPNIFICAGMSSGGKDSCEGDSGGPLVIEENGQWNLIGIISWGIGCALPNQPGVYTRITEFARWIHQIIAY